MKIVGVVVVLVVCAMALEVPVFPLRQPRFPTESLTLNLFEDRYLALARAVVSSPQRTFAAVYCGDVASVLPRGSSPPTPLVGESNVGVLCEVVRSHQSSKEEGRGCSIRLEATAFARCVVQSVVSSPATGGQLPYVVVEAAPLVDDGERTVTDEEREAARAMADVEALVGKVWGPFNAVAGDEGDRSDEAKRYEAVMRFAPSLESDECVVAELERQCLLSPSCVGFAPSRTELFSFALLATLSLSPAERQRGLECTDAVARLRRVSAELNSGRSWLAARAALHDLFC